MDNIRINGKLYTKEYIRKINISETVSFTPIVVSVIEFLKIWWDDSLYVKVNTSGSTGEPKTIELPKSSMLASAEATLKFFGLKQNANILLVMSPQYIAGKMMIIRAIAGNLNLCAEEPVSDITPYLNKEYDFCALVPYQALTTIKRSGKQYFNNIKTLIIGGGKVDSELESLLLETSVECYSTYGMTETASHVALKKISAEFTAFQALPGIIFDTDERECLIIKNEYLPEKEIITNDVVKLNDSTTFIWKGRFDNVINSGGVKLYPETIEDKIKDLINIPFFITKFDHELLGEAVALVLECDKPEINEESRILSEIESVVNKYEKPRKIVYKSCFELTPTGKIRRQI